MIKNRVRELPSGFPREWGAIQNQAVLYCTEQLCMNAQGNKVPLRTLQPYEWCWEFVKIFQDGIGTSLTARSIVWGRNKDWRIKMTFFFRYFSAFELRWNANPGHLTPGHLASTFLPCLHSSCARQGDVAGGVCVARPRVRGRLSCSPAVVVSLSIKIDPKLANVRCRCQ